MQEMADQAKSEQLFAQWYKRPFGEGSFGVVAVNANKTELRVGGEGKREGMGSRVPGVPLVKGSFVRRTVLAKHNPYPDFRLS